MMMTLNMCNIGNDTGDINDDDDNGVTDHNKVIHYNHDIDDYNEEIN